MKQINNYILLVDYYRRPSRQRNTAGRYRVAAKTEKEAIKLLREKIGFGSIKVYYMCEPDDKHNIEYKRVVKEEYINGQYTQVEPLHATTRKIS